ncbi:hypothetical protein ACHQM5_005253 [Ranunculus cassubicifolius]
MEPSVRRKTKRRIGMLRFIETASRKSIRMSELDSAPERTPKSGDDIVFRILSPRRCFAGVTVLACDDEGTLSALIHGADWDAVRDNSVIRIKSYKLVDDMAHFYDKVLHVFKYELEPSDVDMEAIFDTTKWPKDRACKYYEELSFKDPRPAVLPSRVHGEPQGLHSYNSSGDVTKDIVPNDKWINHMLTMMKPMIQKLGTLERPQDVIHEFPYTWRKLLLDAVEREAKAVQGSSAGELNDKMSEATLDEDNGMVA